MKRIITLACALVSGLLFLSSCDTMETVYEEFKGDGPTQYVEKVKDVMVSPGFNKAKLSWGPLRDPRIKKVSISWANNSDSRTFDWDPSTPFEAVVDNLAEGSTIFSITTYDNAGHNSVTVDVTSTIYGENFKKNIEESAVTNGTYNETTNEIKLALRHTANVYYKGMMLIYTNLEGAEVKVPVEDGVESVSIMDAANLDIKYASIFAPQEDCMEYYESPAKTYEELKIPVFNLESDKIVFAAASGCSKVIGLTANRAPINVQTSAKWLSVQENSGKITVTTTSLNTGDARTAIVSVVAKDGKADITVKQTMNRIGTAYGKEGVIWWQNTDNPSEYKIISAARGTCKFSTVNEDTKCTGENGKSTVNGTTKDNNEILMALGDKEKYPAVWWCHNLGPGWYMPSGLELQALIEAYNGGTYTYAQLNGKRVSQLAASAQQARDKFDNALVKDCEGYKLNEAAKDQNGDWIWGTRQNTTALEWAARMGVSGYGARSKQFDGNEKSGPFYTRAMKVVYIEED